MDVILSLNAVVTEFIPQALRCRIMMTTSNLRRGTTMPKLGPDQITEKLKALPGWERRGEAIAKQYTFKAFMDGIRFLNRIAEIAEQMDHHPDVTINYRRITFSLSTHDQGGATEKDVKLGEAIEREFKASGQG